jgi:hypothetical protein
MSHEREKPKLDFSQPDSPHFQLPATQDAESVVQAWEEVEEGRFMPRRIRGSCTGRALG